MRLTMHTDYALRVLIHLGLAPDRLCTVEEIASAYDVSRHHLDKVARHLVKLGWVESSRGRSGGLRLARAPEAIRIGEVVRGTEPDFHLVACLVPGDDSCCIDGLCALKGALYEARKAFLGVLDRYTLADVLTRPERLERALGLVSLSSS